MNPEQSTKLFYKRKKSYVIAKKLYGSLCESLYLGVRMTYQLCTTVFRLNSLPKSLKVSSLKIFLSEIR